MLVDRRALAGLVFGALFAATIITASIAAAYPRLSGAGELLMALVVAVSSLMGFAAAALALTIHVLISAASSLEETPRNEPPAGNGDRSWRNLSA